jgi:alkylation response protein AidB-like acyl-CoA dehydrogenase
MEFSFDGTLARLRDRGRNLGRSLVEPSVVDRDREAAWNPQLFTSLAEAGLTGVLVPVRDGGLGLTILETVALLDGFGEGSADAGLAFAIGTHALLCGVPIATLGDSAQRRRYLSGQRLGALALREVDGGATVNGGGVTAIHTGHGWRLDGAQSNVVNAPNAGYFLITAATGRGQRTAFLIDRDTPGVLLQREPEATSLRTAPTAGLVFGGCQVASSAVLGSVGAATTELVPLVAMLDRTCLLAPWLGILRALAGHTLALATEQSLFGSPMVRSQSVRLAVVDIQTQVELGAGLLYRAAWQLDQLDQASRRDTASAKLFLANAVRDAVTTAGEFARVTPHHLVERINRDVLALTAGGGAEVLRSVVAGALLELG